MCEDCEEVRQKERERHKKKALLQEKEYINSLEVEANVEVEARNQRGEKTPLYLIHDAWLKKVSLSVCVSFLARKLLLCCFYVVL